MSLWLPRLAAAVAGAALWSACVWGQQPPPAQKRQTLYYDRYEASQRQPLFAETCMRDEDAVSHYCVKKCKAGYVAVEPKSTPRQCRSEKPLPPGQLPQPYRRQEAIQPVPPPRPATKIPGS
jgi:hypothetical protein